MNIYEYIKNTSSGRISENFIKESHRTKLNKVLERNNLQHLKYVVYKYGKGFYIHFKIPSESTDGIFYDSILNLEKNIPITPNNFKDYSFKYISNSPDFIFFYQYLFNKNDLLINELTEKLPMEGIVNPPEKNNKENDIYNCKGLYWIILTIETLKMNPIQLSRISLPLDFNILKNNFKSYYEIEIEIKNIKNKIKTNKRKSDNKSPVSVNDRSKSIVKKFNTNNIVNKNKVSNSNLNSINKSSFKTKSFSTSNKIKKKR